MTDPPLQPGEYVRFRAFGSPTSEVEARPGRLIRLHDRGLPAAMALVHWLDEDGEDSVPADRLTRAEPDPQVLPIEDEDGAPVPAELQRGGQLWMGVLDGLRSGFLAHRASSWSAADLHATADWVMVRLAPVLWPLLPSNPDSAAGLDADAQAEREADAAEGDDTPDEIAARTEAPADAPMPTDLPDHPDTER